jgi:indolepyruvate ferredoxin oxidoreductase alpha subunit
MKDLGDMLLRREAFSEIVIGNTTLVRAFIEAGTRVLTSYPGSPTPEIATAIDAVPREKRPFYFEFSVNEKVATEVAYGASVNGHLSTVFFKSVGLNVAADTFVQLGLMDLLGGMIVVLGDDPGANSSQNEQDNRHFAKMSYIPVFEPATPTEVYSMYREAAKLSRERRMPIILRLTTHVCHQKEKVSFDRWEPRPMDRTPRFDARSGEYVPITTNMHQLKRRALAKLSAFGEYTDSSATHRIDDNGNRSRGVITAGLPYLSVLDALEGAECKPDILKLGIVHPIPRTLVKRFLAEHAEVKIIEELDDLLEKEIKALAYEERLATRIVGKQGQEDWVGEYLPAKTRAVLASTWPDLFPARTGPAREKLPRAAPSTAALRDRPIAPARPPQLCPGCGHRSAFHAINRALAKEDITVADIGCHTLGYLPPYEIGQLLMCMGSSTGVASGLRLFNDQRKVVCFLGDSTFFHAGMAGIVNALFNKHPVVLILMENGTTAMTGHQDLPSSGRNFNEPTQAIPVRQALEGLGVKNIDEVDAYKQATLTGMVKAALARNEFSVIIAKHPCMLKFTRDQRKRPGYKQRRVEVDQGECGRIHECIEKFACPTFMRGPDGSVQTNPDLCIGDGSCIQSCPAKAIHPVEERGRS